MNLLEIIAERDKLKFESSALQLRQNGITTKLMELNNLYNNTLINSFLDYINVELKDEGMLVKTYHFIPSTGIVKKEYFDVVIKGKQEYVEDHVFTIPFETSHIKSYVDTLIDFMSEFCPDFDYHIEEYDNTFFCFKYENTLSDGKEMSDSKVGTIVIIFTKKN